MIPLPRTAALVLALALAGAGAARAQYAIPESAKNGRYPPGMYTGPCKATNPSSNIPLESTTRSVVEATFFLFPNGQRVGEVLAPGCSPVRLPPGKYIMQVRRIEDVFKLHCQFWASHVCKQSGLVRVNFHQDQQETPFTIAAGAPPPRAPGKPRKPEVKIVSPANGDQFAFDGGSPGQLFIDLEGKPDNCQQPITWEIQDVGYSEKTFTPATGNKVKLRLRGLPRSNSDFGKKKITARACGASDAVTVELFYSPTARNHPGEGSAVTPNWFYYWGQTSARQGYAPVYEPKRTSGFGSHPVQAQYDYSADRVVVTDQLFSLVCANRPNGVASTGIDCYGELLRHESWHKKQRHDWWGTTNPLALGFLARRKVDFDNDLVPDSVEKRLAASRGCRWWDPTSCSGRPNNSVLDVEMDAYRKGWEWKIGSADAEDWSSCSQQLSQRVGKQWKKPRTCQ